VAVALFALAACRIEDPFSCALDEHCGANGRCEPVGYCSFPDAACAGGRSYDELAGDDLAGTCVSLESCPATYASTIPGTSSRYRVVGQGTAWTAAQDDCADDGSGTHLAVIGSEAERTGLAALLNGGFWIGFSDRVAEGTFRWVTREASQFTAWTSGQPDDLDGTEDCVEQRRNGSTWQDQSCADLIAYICECDGLAPDPAAF
jgi:hypothetical protein